MDPAEAAEILTLIERCETRQQKIILLQSVVTLAMDKGVLEGMKLIVRLDDYVANATDKEDD
jgi:hypothetical protein